MEHPGTWQLFVKRKDNIGLNVLVQKEKYLLEESRFHQMIYMDYMVNQHMGGGSLPQLTPEENSENNYVVDDYIDDYFI
jgi:hypothetical protein